MDFEVANVHHLFFIFFYFVSLCSCSSHLVCWNTDIFQSGSAAARLSVCLSVCLLGTCGISRNGGAFVKPAALQRRRVSVLGVTVNFDPATARRHSALLPVSAHSHAAPVTAA